MTSRQHLIGLTTATNITLCLTNIWQVFRKCFYQQRALLIISRLLQKRKARYLHDTFFQCALHDASEDCIHLSEYGVATIYYIVMWCERPKCSQLTLNSDEDGGQKRERKKVVLQSNDRSPKPIWFLDHVIQETFSFFWGEEENKSVVVFQVSSSTSILHAWGSGWLSQSFFSSS